MKVNVKAPHGGKNYFNIPCNHPTTFDFGQVRPVYSRPLFYGDEIKVNLKMLVRTAPLTYPTFGNVKFVHRAFFVPFRLVNPFYHEFRNNIRVTYSSGATGEAHLFFFNTQNIINHFCSYVYEGNRIYIGSYKASGYPAFQFNGTGSKMSSAQGYEHVYVGRVLSSEFIDARVVYTDNGSQFNQDYFSEFKKYSGFTPDFVYSLDASYIQNDDNRYTYHVCCKFTPYGRYVLKVFNSLGMKIPFDMSRQYLGVVSQVAHQTPVCYKPADYNALSVLSYIKILSDYYVPSQFQISSPFQQLLRILQNRANSYSSMNQNFDLSYTESEQSVYTPLSYVLEAFKIGFQVFSGSNYFTDAWQTENSVVSSSQYRRNALAYNRLAFMADAITQESRQNTIINNDYGNEFDSGDISILTEQANSIGHTWLRKVQNFVTRNNIVGSRVVDNLLARFGVRPSDAKLQLSSYIGRSENPLQIQDVTATASTGTSVSSSTLGEYAGKAFSVNISNKDFKFEANEEGLFVIFSCLTNHDNLGQQGTQRFHFLREYTDFPIPEFEKVGMEPVSCGELVMPTLIQDGNLNLNYEPYTFDHVFGFVPRYSSFKYPFNLQSGDFTIPSVGGGLLGELSAFHLQRMLRLTPMTSFTLENYRAKSTPYQKISPTAQKEILYDNGIQYNRIFNVVDNQQDHFFAILQFDVRLTSSTLLPVKDSFDIDGFRDVEVNENGSVIS